MKPKINGKKKLIVPGKKEIKSLLKNKKLNLKKL